MTILMFTDPHWSDRPRDAYRFGIFDFIAEQREKHNASLVVILGDLTDEKDKHSSRLVNQIVKGLRQISEHCPVIILKGNHDYLADPASPFFEFLNHMMNIRFVVTPRTYTSSEGSKLFFIPHIKDEAEWDNLKLDIRPDFAFIHQTVTGAISESGQRLDGFSLKPLNRLKARGIFGGDVHKPHTIDPVTYIGPPYHIRFGDNFEPRCLLLNEKTGDYEELYYECPRKWSVTIREPDELLNKDLRAGDQVKVALELTREELPDWPVYKGRIVQLLAELGLESYGVELRVQKSTKLRNKEKRLEEVVKNKLPADVLGSFMKKEKLPRAVREVGLQLLKD